MISDNSLKRPMSEVGYRRHNFQRCRCPPTHVAHTLTYAYARRSRTCLDI
jgi:hypothetical protein